MLLLITNCSHSVIKCYDEHLLLRQDVARISHVVSIFIFLAVNVHQYRKVSIAQVRSVCQLNHNRQKHYQVKLLKLKLLLKLKSVNTN